MSCCVQQYLPADDDIVQRVEDLVHLKLRAREGYQQRVRGRGRRHRGFLPPNALELLVYTNEDSILHITGYQQTDDNCVLDLQDNGTILRMFHTHPGHRNPFDPNNPLPGLHMHFPSARFHLIEGRHRSYAYPLAGDGFADIGDALSSFCDELGIIMESWQPFLKEEDI